VSTPIHVTVWDDHDAPGPPAVLVHGTMTWGTDAHGFAAQRPLAARFRLLVVDRRGFGCSPDVDRSDYAVDAADVAGLLGDGAHLVGHSYGGVVAMLAAARRPGAVRSLALIEPAAHRAAAGHPAVAAALHWMRTAVADPAASASAEEWLRRSTEAVGMPALEPTPERLRAVRTAMTERPCWDAEIPVSDLAAAPWPKLVIAGTWETAPPAYREIAGAASIACAEVVAESIGGRMLRVPGASHWPQREQPGLVNAALADLWASAAG
jgi:pimeloyl-ACP methyl ester carboxylesterase